MIIYISSPYSNGNKSDNVLRAVEVGDALLAKGHIPFIPHLNHWWDIISPKPWEEWLRIDLELMSMCDAVLRLEGESKGADMEVAEAGKRCMIIFNSLEEVAEAEREVK